MNKNEKLTRKEVEAMLPDYIFNRLSADERTEFEIAVVEYTDLEIEVLKGQELFAKIENFDYKKLLKDKSQYLPDRVVERLERNRQLYVRKPPNIRRLVLAFAFAASLIIYIGVQNNFSITKFLGKESENNSITVSHNVLATPYFWTALEEVLIAENLYAEDIYDGYIEDLFEDYDLNYLLLLDKIENMDESSFQDLIKSYR